MPTKMTKKQLELAHYRRLLLDDRLQELDDLITGRGSSLVPFVSGEDGKASDEKADALIDRLIGCLKRRRKLENRPAPDEKTEEMYRSFLYLAIFGLVNRENRRVRNAEVCTPVESFADVVRFTEELEPSGLESHEDFLLTDLDNFVSRYHVGFHKAMDMPVYGTFGLLLYAMRDHAEHFALYSLSRKEQRALCRKYGTRLGLSLNEKKKLTDDVFEEMYSEPIDADDLDYWNKKNAYDSAVREGVFQGTFEEYEEWEYEMTVRSYQQSPVDKESVEEQLGYKEEVVEAVSSLKETDTYDDSEALSGIDKKEIDRQMRKKSHLDSFENAVEWLNGLTNIKRYCDSFDAFARLYFESDRSRLQSDVTDMIDAFLFEQKLSAFSLGDDYLMINFYFDRLRKQIEKELERGRRK